ncbi:hypothetical protein DOTSEDRAFT_173233 [Dothistroma septosporum NZE10]|uniref:Protein PBN1 n=1 Tax=Dothistroma septosporum (strain NZE10 / CBS 128990) TaxID=675120 RepID=M2Y385_DOTSN|nr:hypothetical protein DOTSEDRAFT_173233 [Dothistroma septosporum NZE10]
MRQRITYLLSNGTGVDPADITVGDTELTYAQAHNAAEERRITIGYSELPQEIQTILKDFHELHIRIASWQNYPAFSPAVSRISPGLHAFFTPLKQRDDTVEISLCANLQTLFGDTGSKLKCSSASNSFSKPPVLSERFASSSTWQFYHDPFDLMTMNTNLQKSLCDQVSAESSLGKVCKILSSTITAAYVDYDFDVISHAVTITILWPPTSAHTDRHEKFGARKIDSSDRLEVGIISPEQPPEDEPESLSMAGFLTVVGEDSKPAATMFSFPARHHPLPADSTYTVNFQNPTGLHPKLEITLPRTSTTPPKTSCALHAYWTLPSTLFIDKYQFTDPLSLQSQNLQSLRSISGSQDLEAPAWVISTWGSASLFELTHPAPPAEKKPADEHSTHEESSQEEEEEQNQDWKITIPTHLRYLNATGLSDSSSLTHLSIPWPVVYWACDAEEGLKMGTNPFDRVNIGYDGLFGPRTMFYHLTPDTRTDKQILVEKLRVPVLDPERVEAKWVPVGTMVVVVLGFAWVLWQLIRPVGRREGKSVTAEKKEK